MRNDLMMICFRSSLKSFYLRQKMNWALCWPDWEVSWSTKFVNLKGNGDFGLSNMSSLSAKFVNLK